jgi:hypothetical protein
MMGVDITVDGTYLGSLEMFVNLPDFRMTMTPGTFLTRLYSGDHTITLTASSSTVTESPDRVVVSITDLGDNPELFQVRLNHYGSYESRRFWTCGGAGMIWAAASGWAAQASQMAGASVTIDGDEVSQPAIYQNSSETHLGFVPVQVMLPELSPGDHTLEVLPLPSTRTDYNDRLAVVVLELTAPTQVLAASTPISNEACLHQDGGGTIASGAFSSAGGTILLRAMASAWARASASQLNLAVTVDKTARGKVTGYASRSNFHVPLVSADILITNLPPGQHAVALVADSSTITDTNDRCTVSVLELAPAMPT